MRCTEFAREGGKFRFTNNAMTVAVLPSVTKIQSTSSKSKFSATKTDQGDRRCPI
jgi:hypothetical protein